jgi:hypothetical protein
MGAFGLWESVSVNGIDAWIGRAIASEFIKFYSNTAKKTKK